MCLFCERAFFLDILSTFPRGNNGGLVQLKCMLTSSISNFVAVNGNADLILGFGCRIKISLLPLWSEINCYLNWNSEQISSTSTEPDIPSSLQIFLYLISFLLQPYVCINMFYKEDHLSHRLWEYSRKQETHSYPPEVVRITLTPSCVPISGLPQWHYVYSGTLT